MKILAPYLSCVLEPSDETVDGVNPLDQALAAGYSQIFIPSQDGYFKYHALQPGEGGKRRFVCLQVKDVPGLTLPKISPGVQFLPAGKIPMDLFDEIKEFFRQVIVKKGRALEAMAWILWNETDGYHILIPNQRVGHGSASYDWSSLPAGSSIIVDIHSHADFNAFFSGTDDHDDQNCIRFSGVVGHNNTPNRSMKFRFNYLGNRMEINLQDLFEVVEPPPVPVPEDWFDKVVTQTYPTSPYQGAGYNAYGRNYDQTFHRGAGPGQGKPPQANTHEEWQSQRRFLGMSGIHGAAIEVGEATEITPPAEPEVGGTPQKKPSRSERRAQAAQERSSRARERGQRLTHELAPGQQGQPTSEAKSSGHHGDAQEEGGPDSGHTFLDTPGGLVQVGADALGESYELYRRAGLEGLLEDQESALEQEDRLSEQAEAHLGHQFRSIDPDGGVYATMCINHGKDVATAFMAIELATVELVKAPELLNQQVADMFCMVDDEAKLRIFRNMAELLPAEAKDKLATEGL